MFSRLKQFVIVTFIDKDILLVYPLFQGKESDLEKITFR